MNPPLLKSLDHLFATKAINAVHVRQTNCWLHMSVSMSVKWKNHLMFVYLKMFFLKQFIIFWQLNITWWVKCYVSES